MLLLLTLSPPSMIPSPPSHHPPPFPSLSHSLSPSLPPFLPPSPPHLSLPSTLSPPPHCLSLSPFSLLTSRERQKEVNTNFTKPAVMKKWTTLGREFEWGRPNLDLLRKYPPPHKMLFHTNKFVGTVNHPHSLPHTTYLILTS